MIKVIRSYQGIDIISLKNNNIEIIVTNYGCTILKMLVHDKENEIKDVVLGYSTIDEYATKSGTYMGAVVGRVANRISKGKFKLNNKEYLLPINNGPNSLHGGINGFSYKVFSYEMNEDEVIFCYKSIDGEEGYPGNLILKVIYKLLDNGLEIKYHASCDQDTIINITNHSYFNLSGKPCSIDNHILEVKANKIGCIDKDGLYNGKIISVNNTSFDFNKPTLIKNNINNENDQLLLGQGYDHPFIFNTTTNQVILYYPITGIELTVSTSLPTCQIYSANYLNGIDKYGNTMNKRDALCIETQYLPDSINKEEKPSVILRKGEVYEEQTSYTFKIK